MIVFPNCKINLGLEILRKRPDGYHDLQTVFYPVPLTDALEFVPSSSFQFSYSGIPVEGDPSSNLVVKAYELLKSRYEQLPTLALHLHKRIPMGAGLGGGSSDGAFTLTAINDHFHLHISKEELNDLALELGSDCPFFVLNKPALAFGRGELMEVIDVNLKGFYIAIIHPSIHVSTKDAFEGIKPCENASDLKELIRQPVDQWKNTIINAFEETVGRKHPQILEIKSKFYDHGAVYASMSGSGSSVYGLFREKPTLSNMPAADVLKL